MLFTQVGMLSEASAESIIPKGLEKYAFHFTAHVKTALLFHSQQLMIMQSALRYY